MRRMAIAATIALVASLILPGSASAWSQSPCANGELRAEAAEVVKEPSKTVVYIPGVVDCAVKIPGPEFVVAVFEFDSETGYYHHGLMRAYDTAGPTTFDLVGEIGFLGGMSDTGLCIMPDEYVRLSCVHVSTELTVTKLSVSDKRVRHAIVLKHVDVTPNCGNCWYMP